MAFTTSPRTWLWLSLCCLTAQSHAESSSSLPPVGDVSACKIPSDPWPDNDGPYLGQGFYTPKQLEFCVPATGTLHGFMFFVDFPDAVGTDQETPQDLHDFYLPAAERFFQESSYGRLELDIQYDASQYFRMPQKSDTYGFDNLTTERHTKYIQDALAARGAAGGRSVAPTDVLYIVPVTGARALTPSWAFNSEVRAGGGARVARKAVTFSWNRTTPLVFAHQTGHAFCLDLYFSTRARSADTYEFVGPWDVMGKSTLPASPDFLAWDKWRMGWLDDAQVACVGGGGGASTRHVLTPIEVAGGVKAVVVAKNTTDVLVAEVRSQRGVDKGFCGPGGVLLYSVSTRYYTGDGPVQVFDTTPKTKGCNGAYLDDAPMTEVEKPFQVPDWDVTVEVMNIITTTNEYDIKVDILEHGK